MHCLLFNINKQLADDIRSAGCYRIAHFLRGYGWDAEVIEYALGWDLPRLKELARSRITKKTKWIGTSHLFSVWSDTMEDFLLWIKQEYPWIKIISGSSTNPEFESQAIEYYIQGYGELALLELLKYLFSNGPAPKFDLLSLGGKKVIPAISHYPAFPMSKLMIKYQDRDFILPGEHLGIEFSRGCKFTCSYCNFPVLGVKGDHTRDAEDFREQVMDAYDRWGVTGYYVADETFNDRTEKITKFADVVETLPFEPWFTAYIRADLLVSRPRDREEMARMGVRGHYYGIESFNHQAAKSIGKGMHPDRIKQGLIDARKYFESTGNGLYRGQIGLIAGLPGENIKDIEDNRQWLVDNWHGQYWHLFALFLAGPPAKPSKFTKELLKYGYETMTEKEIDSALHGSTLTRKEFDFVSKLYTRSGTIHWKNDKMNIVQARELEKKWYHDTVDFTKPNPYTKLPSYRIGATIFHELSMPQRLDLDNYSAQPIRNQKRFQIVENYIERKLSL